MPQWLTVAGDVHGVVAERMRRTLSQAGIKSRVSGDKVQVVKEAVMEEAWGYVLDLLDCHGLIVSNADPDMVKPYKSLEPDVLLAAAWDAVRSSVDGRDRIVRLLHGFVWSQGLPNANHRSATLLVNELLDAKDISEEQVGQCSGPFWDASKPLIKEQEFAPGGKDNPELRGKHLAAAQAYVDCISPAGARSSPPDA